MVHFKLQKEICQVTEFKDTCPIDGAIYNESTVRKKKAKWYGAHKINATNEEEIKKHYGDVTKSVNIDRVTLVVEEKNNTVSLKCYTFERYRPVGMKYFIVRKTMHYVSFNSKYNNFYSGNRQSKQKKLISKTIRTNDWRSIINELSSIPPHFNHISMSKENTNDVFNIEVYNTNYGWDVMNKSLGVFFKRICEIKGVPSDFDNNRCRNLGGLSEYFFSKYLTFNNFGYPDEWVKFLDIPIKKNYLVKHSSLVEGFMKQYNFKGTKLRKLLNQSPTLHFHSIYYLYNLLGVDYFNKIKDDFFKNSSTVSFSVQSNDDLLNNKEKSYVVDLINDCDVTISVLQDHLGFKKKLETYGEYVKLKSNTRKEFNDEHYEWSNLLSSYRNGKVIRFYEGEMKREIQEVIYGLHVDYYPILLTNSEQYNNESQIQKNCVRTYLEDVNNFIISLRERDPKGDNRATIEYRYVKGEAPKRVQSLGRFNESLHSNWDFVLEELDNRINRLWNQNVIVTPNMCKEFPSGKTIERKSIWVDYDKLKDDYRKGVRLEWDNREDYSCGFNLDFF